MDKEEKETCRHGGNQRVEKAKGKRFIINGSMGEEKVASTEGRREKEWMKRQM